MPDARDLVIQTLAESEADLQSQVTALTHQLADVVVERETLRILYQQEYTGRVHAEAALTRSREHMRHHVGQAEDAVQAFGM